MEMARLAQPTETEFLQGLGQAYAKRSFVRSLSGAWRLSPTKTATQF